MRIVIVGSGGHAEVVADILALAGGVEPVGYVTRDEPSGPDAMGGLPMLGRDDDLSFPHDGVVIAVGDNAVRRKVYDRYRQRGETLASAIHPSAIIAADAVIEPGCVICAGVVVNPGSRIRANTILNTGCTVDHHGDIGPHAHVAPGVNLAGNVNVNEGAFVGIGACAIQGVTIGAWSIVGAGAAVVEDVPPQTTVVGVPARIK